MDEMTYISIKMKTLFISVWLNCDAIFRNVWYPGLPIQWGNLNNFMIKKNSICYISLEQHFGAPKYNLKSATTQLNSISDLMKITFGNNVNQVNL